jgi:exopolysaccharide biosynthesis protein
VDALNLDGGGSSVLAVRNRVVNKPSDGSERSVSNALLVMR